jgi:hypothetical protein
MARGKEPYPVEFRQMVKLVRSGRTPEALSREFGPSGCAVSSAGRTQRAIRSCLFDRLHAQVVVVEGLQPWRDRSPKTGGCFTATLKRSIVSRETVFRDRDPWPVQVRVVLSLTGSLDLLATAPREPTRSGSGVDSWHR